jgi:SWIM zinc finger
VESFNSWILQARELPILNLLEKIRQQLMVWFTERRRRGSQMHGILTPSVDSKVTVAINKARRHQVLRANDVEFEVITDCITCAVSISISTYSCKSWQQSGIPCSHAVAALLTDGKNVRDYTCQYLSVSNYQVAYNETIHPIQDQSFWNERGTNHDDFVEPISDTTNEAVYPPQTRRPPGRPKKKRVRTENFGLAKQATHCGRCGKVEHYRTSCKEPIS